MGFPPNLHRRLQTPSLLQLKPDQLESENENRIAWFLNETGVAGKNIQFRKKVLRWTRVVWRQITSRFFFFSFIEMRFWISHFLSAACNISPLNEWIIPLLGRPRHHQSAKSWQILSSWRQPWLAAYRYSKLAFDSAALLNKCWNGQLCLFLQTWPKLIHTRR